MKRRLLLIFGTLSLFLCFQVGNLNARIAADKYNDFDGDGKTDYRVRRYSNGGDFRNYDWFILRSSDGGYSQTRWGMVNLQSPIQDDLTVSGDFDGDGKTDIAVWRRSSASPAVPTYFYILRSSDNTALAVQFGLTSDLPICQDYDGDGKTDMAVYRPGAGGVSTWYMLQSRAGFQSLTLQKCCSAYRGDFDGDGRGDFAVFYGEGNPAVSKFYIVHSRQKKAKFVTFGNFNEIPALGDYDGDGKTDIGVWNSVNEAPNGVWRWIRSSDGQTGSANPGLGVVTGDTAVQGDYDGDGKTDPAILRRGTDGLKYFIVQGSQRGRFIVQWGLDTDLP